MQERGQSCVSPLDPKMSLVLTYFCFSASFLCSEVSVHSALLSMPERGGSAASPAAGDVPSLCSAGGHSHAGTAATATEDHGPGDRSWPRDPPRPGDARRHMGGPSWGLPLPPLSDRVAGAGGYLWC